MASIEFACPHCSGRFELANPPAGEHVACPLCRQMLAIPAELPEPEEDSVGAQARAEETEFAVLRAGEVKAPPIAFDVGKRSARPALDVPSLAREDKPVAESLSREAKEHRRQIRSLVWMIGGAVLLAIAAAVLARF